MPHALEHTLGINQTTGDARGKSIWLTSPVTTALAQNPGAWNIFICSGVVFAPHRG